MGGGEEGGERPKRHREIFLKRNVSEAAASSRGKSSFWSDFETRSHFKTEKCLLPPDLFG